MAMHRLLLAFTLFCFFCSGILAAEYSFKASHDLEGKIIVTKDSGTPKNVAETLDSEKNLTSIKPDSSDITLYLLPKVALDSKCVDLYGDDVFRSSQCFALSEEGPWIGYIEDKAPNFVFLGEDVTLGNFTCDEIGPNYQGAFDCALINGTLIASFSALQSNSSDSFFVEGEVDVVLDDFEEAMLTILYHRIYAGRYRISRMNAIAEENLARRNSARGPVGAVYFLAAAAMFFLILVSSTMMGWLIPFPFKSKPVFAFLFHFAIQAVLIIIITGSAGILGWVICGFVIGIAAFVASMFYIYYRTSKKFSDDNIEMTEIGKKSNNSNSGSSAKWTTRPAELGLSQKIISSCGGIFTVASIVIAILVFYPGWDATKYNYSVWDRITQREIIEIQPLTVAKSTLALYSYDGIVTAFKVNFLLEPFTKQCGWLYNQTLKTNDEKERAIGDNYVRLYLIDMDEYIPDDYLAYSTVNEFFIRSLRPGARPTAEPSNNDIVVSPADARIAAFQNVDKDFKFFVKGSEINVSKLVYFDDYKDLFEGGTLVIVRLAPQDYHRFHAHQDGKVVFQQEIDSTIYSVNADAVQSENDVLLNDRIVSIIDSPEYGEMAFIAVGATCVGSVILDKKIDDAFEKGKEVGRFEFGGSTIVLVFQKDKVVVDADLVEATMNNVETLVQVGTQIMKRKL